MAINARTISRGHKLLGLVVGFQFLFWTVSGFFFTLYPIETIRGEHLRAETPAINMSALPALTPPQTGNAETAELRLVLGEPVWQVRSANGLDIYNAATGESRAALSETEIRAYAESLWAGQGEISSVRLVETPPREAFTGKPLWRVQFDGADTATFWIDAEAARLVAVRTGKWRLFDALWRFHIMDITGEDRFDSWWLKIFAFLGVTTVLFGFALLIQRASKGRLLK